MAVDGISKDAKTTGTGRVGPDAETASPAPDLSAPPATPLPPNTCQLCGHGPAADGWIGQEIGLIFVRRRRTVSGPLCHDCGISLFRQFTSRTLVTGWWVISLPVNIVTILRNLVFRRQLGRLNPPGLRVTGPDLRPRPLEPGRPLIARPGTWGGVAIVAITAIGIIAAIAGEADRDRAGTIVGAGRLSANDLRVGDCFHEPTRDEFTAVRAVPCSEPHSHEVIHQFVMSSSGYPDDDGFSTAASTECLPAFERYVNAHQGPELDVVYFVPTEAAWRNSDHTISCVVLTRTLPG